MELRQSTFDPKFWEVISNGIVIQEIAISFPLKDIPKQFASLEEIDSWLEKTESKKVKNYALWLLARRSYSKAMLLKKLREKKYSENRCQRVIEECENSGYLSDDNYAQMLLEQKIRQGYGPRYIEQYFRNKGIDAKLVRKKMDLKMQKEAVKKWAQKISSKDRMKAVAFLLRKGFDLPICQAIFKL
ncbi:MAG TPA: regulatory protein RecX [Chlamydiales bacterium]|nr:regulatory protein RecX [Chlamydiales bacterium]